MNTRAEVGKFEFNIDSLGFLDGQVGLEWEHLLVDAEEGGHGTGPRHEPSYVTTRLLGAFERVVLHVEVRGEELHCFVVDRVLGEGEETTEEVGGTHQLERFRPRRFGTVFVRVGGDGVDSTLEKKQHTVHDAHDQMRRLAQLSH